MARAIDRQKFGWVVPASLFALAACQTREAPLTSALPPASGSAANGRTITAGERVSLGDHIVVEDGVAYYVTAYDNRKRPLQAQTPSPILAHVRPQILMDTTPPARLMLDEENLLTPAKDQGLRPAGSVFAATALLEAEYLIQSGVNLDLSEEYVINLMNENRAVDYTGGGADEKLQIASYYGVPPTTQWPYIDNGSTVLAQARPAVPGAPATDAAFETLLGSNGFDRDLANYNTASFPPLAAHDAAVYGPTDIVQLASTTDPSAFEAALAQNHPIVIGAAPGTWSQDPNTGVFSYDSTGNQTINHSLLVVGYDHAKQIFRVKNSWGVAWNNNGLADFTYDLVTKTASYAYYVDQISPSAAGTLGAGAWVGFWTAKLNGASGVAVIRQAYGSTSDGGGTLSEGLTNVGTFYGEDGSTTVIPSFLSGNARTATFGATGTGAWSITLARQAGAQSATATSTLGNSTWYKCNPLVAGSYTNNPAPTTYQTALDDAYVLPACATATQAPDPIMIYGQKSYFSASTNDSDAYVAQSTLSFPASLACGGGYCYLADGSNNRVLIFSGFPSSGALPVAVLGQSNFTSNFPNRGLSAATSASLALPYSLAVSGTKLLIVDTSNNRVLVYNHLPTTSGVAADVVIGQADFVSTAINRGSTLPSASSLDFPSAITVDATTGRIVISDVGNARILVYGAVPTSNGAAATAVIGQASFTANAVNAGGPASAQSLGAADGLSVTASGKLIVADTTNHRVLIYPSVSLTNNPAATVVIGQSTMAGVSAGTSATQLTDPVGVLEVGSALYIADYGNDRVLYFSAEPTVNGAAATAVIGQASFTTNTACPAPATASCMTYPWSLYSDGTKLVVSDSGDSRLLEFNTLPTAQVAANQVYGQGSFAGKSANQTPTPNAQGLSWPGYVARIPGTKWLAIAERDNGRVTLWDKDHPELGAQYAIGVPSVTTYGTGVCGTTGNDAASICGGTWGIASDGSYLYVTDLWAHRLLVFDLSHLASGMSASFALGQPDLNSIASNRGGKVAANTLSAPSGAAKIFNNQLYLSDMGNCRVLVYNLPITQNGQAAVKVIGQPDFATNTCIADGQHPGYTMGGGGGIYVDATHFAVEAYARILFWNSLHPGGLVSATGVFGQSDYTSGVHDHGNAPGVIGNNTLSAADADMIYAGGYYIANDKENGRVLLFTTFPTGTNVTADYVLGQNSFTQDLAIYGTPDGSTFEDFSGPVGLTADGDSLYIGDAWANRVLRIPFTRLSSFLHH